MKTLALVILFGGVLTGSGSAPAKEGPHVEAAHWEYSGEAGPEHWAALSPQYSSCTSRTQSPIDLTGFIEADLKPIGISYLAGGNQILNNGHTVQVDYAPGSSISLNGDQFELKQLHFHAPSENHINGKSYALEAHLVHADKAGNLAVIALMFDEGAANPALAAIWPLMPQQAGEKKTLPTAFAAAKLLPANHDYYFFDGSLTTPPCTEGVRWLVFKTPLSASRAQVQAFAKLMHHTNNRPVQAANARPVLQ
jgi:carbonic anhydrase